jgi:hypothetical protein
MAQEQQHRYAVGMGNGRQGQQSNLRDSIGSAIKSAPFADLISLAST